MPGALRPDGRCFAVFDSPLLPFLAPRIFAKSTAWGAPRWRDGVWKEQEKRLNKGEIAGEEACRQPRCSRSSKGHTNDLTTGINARYHMRNGASTLPSHDQRYADIFSFNRTQQRRYATAVGTSPEETIERPEIRHIETGQLKRRRRLVNRGQDGGKLAIRKIEIETLNIRRTIVKKVPKTRRRRPFPPSRLRPRPKVHIRIVRSISEKDRGLLNKRRKKWLDKTLKYQATFLSYLTSVDPLGIRKHGRYRSLRRRLFNFKRTRAMTIDMVKMANRRVSDMATPAFAALDCKVHYSAKRHSFPLKLVHDPQWDEVWYAKLFKGTDRSADDAVWHNWQSLDHRFRDSLWHPFLFFVLDLRPARALQFVHVVAREDLITTAELELLADALEHLAGLCLQNSSPMSNPATIQMLIPTFCHVFEKHLSRQKAICSQDLFLSLAEVASRLQQVDDLKRVWDLLITNDARLEYETLLHFGNHFSKFGEHELALLCLERTIQLATGPAAPIIANRKRYLWSCALILRSAGKQDCYHKTSEYVARLLRLGVKLDTLLHNVIMSNAMEAKDYATAFRVYNLLEENGLIANERTYAILLHGCTLSDDPGRFHDFAEHCAKIANEMRYPWVAADYLYYLYMRYHKHDLGSGQARQILSRAFVQFYEPGPLLYLGVRPDDFDLENTFENNVRFPPSQIAIYLMLQVEIRYAMDLGNEALLDLYMRFKSVVALHEHPSLNDLAKGPTIWNAFLLAFCQKQQFASASQLIKDMTNGPADEIAQPNIYSWNIFMYAFFRADQVRAAERVYQIMTDRGVEPDQFTFTVLLKHYAKVQNTERLGTVLQHADTETQLDPLVLRAMTRMTDQRALMRELEKVKLEKENKERDQAEQEAVKERKRWGNIVWSRLPLAKHTQTPVEENVSANSGHDLGGAQFEPVSPNHSTHETVERVSPGLVFRKIEIDAADSPEQEPLEESAITSTSKAEVFRFTAPQPARLSARPQLDALVPKSASTSEAEVSMITAPQPARLSTRPKVDALLSNSFEAKVSRTAARYARLSARPKLDALMPESPVALKTQAGGVDAPSEVPPIQIVQLQPAEDQPRNFSILGLPRSARPLQHLAIHHEIDPPESEIETAERSVQSPSSSVGEQQIEEQTTLKSPIRLPRRSTKRLSHLGAAHNSLTKDIEVANQSTSTSPGPQSALSYRPLKGIIESQQSKESEPPVPSTLRLSSLSRSPQTIFESQQSSVIRASEYSSVRPSFLHSATKNITESQPSGELAESSVVRTRLSRRPLKDKTLNSHTRHERPQRQLTTKTRKPKNIRFTVGSRRSKIKMKKMERVLASVFRKLKLNWKKELRRQSERVAEGPWGKEVEGGR